MGHIVNDDDDDVDGDDDDVDGDDVDDDEYDGVGVGGEFISCV